LSSFRSFSAVLDKLLFAILVSFGLSACVPFPHYETLAPKLDGVVTRDGEPQANVPVNYIYSFRSKPLECDRPSATTLTNSAGEFNFPRTRKFRLYIQLELTQNYKLCFPVDKSFIVGMEEFGLGGAPNYLVVSCDISDNSVEPVCSR